MKLSPLALAIFCLNTPLIAFAQDAASTPFHSGNPPAAETTPTPEARAEQTPPPPPAPPPPAASTPGPIVTTTPKAEQQRPASTPPAVRAVSSSPARKPPAKPAPEEITDNRDDASNGNGGVVKALEKEWEASIVKHDAAVIERLVADDFIGVSSNGKIGDKVTLIYEAKRDKSVYKTAAARQLSVRTYGPHVAVALGITRESGTDGAGRAFDRTFRFTDTWMERGGKWQCIAAHAAVAGRR